MPTAFNIFAMPLIAKAVRAATMSSKDLPAGYEFNPREFFKASEQGIWLDPSDFSTLFQDASGTTPVTAVGQPVGLALDKRLGLALGAELVSNGDFSSGATGWTVTGNDATHIATFSGGTLRYQSDTTSPVLNVSKSNLLPANKTFLVTVVCSAWTSGSVKVAESTLGTLIVNGVGTFTARVSTAVITSLNIQRNSTNVDLTLDSISVREIAGNHAYQTTSASRPTVEARVNYCLATENATEWAKLNNGTGLLPVVTSNAGTDPFGGSSADLVVFNKGAGALTTDYSLLIVGGTLAQVGGLYYSQGIWLKTSDGTARTLRCTSPDGQTTTFSVTSSWQLFTFTQSATSSGSGRISLRISYSGDIGGANNVANILVFGAQSVDGASLNTYQRVNTATDYVDVGAPRYLQFDGTDDGMVTPSINFTGTDKMTVWTGVRKLSDAAAGVVCELSAAVPTNNGSFNIQAPRSGASYGIGVRGSSLNAGDYSTFTAPVTTVISASLTTAAANYAAAQSARFNGVANAGVANSSSVSTGNYGNYPLYIGRRAGTSLPANMRIYQLIVRGAESNAGQIAAGEAYVNAKTRAY